jgi:hypothetical protein
VHALPTLSEGPTCGSCDRLQRDLLCRRYW